LADAASEDFGAATKHFELLNARQFVKFGQIQPNKRKLNIVAGGVITLGSAPPPVEPYAGPTSRNRLKIGGEASEDATPQFGISDDEKSLGNPNRGDSRCGFPNDLGQPLLLRLAAVSAEFGGDRFPRVRTRRRQSC
jgi:hypothetical protein